MDDTQPSDLSVHFSAARGDWETPWKLIGALDQEFHFTLDAAADAGNAVCTQWYGPGSSREDALTEQPWEADTIWCNPPYGKLVPAFVEKGKEAILKGTAKTVVFLLPARTDTKWFHNLLTFGAEIRFIRGRVVFELDGDPILDSKGHPVGAPFPSLLAILKQTHPQWSVLHA